MEEGNNTVKMLKQLNVKDVIFWVSECWDVIETRKLARSLKLLVSEDSEDHKTEDIINEKTVCFIYQKKIPGCEKAEDRDIEEWMNSDDQHKMTDDDIIAMVMARCV